MQDDARASEASFEIRSRMKAACIEDMSLGAFKVRPMQDLLLCLPCSLLAANMHGTVRPSPMQHTLAGKYCSIPQITSHGRTYSQASILDGCLSCAMQRATKERT